MKKTRQLLLLSSRKPTVPVLIVLSRSISLEGQKFRTKLIKITSVDYVQFEKYKKTRKRKGY